jgi:hypothetical protein
MLLFPDDLLRCIREYVLPDEYRLEPHNPHEWGSMAHHRKISEILEEESTAFRWNRELMDEYFTCKNPAMGFRFDRCVVAPDKDKNQRYVVRPLHTTPEAYTKDCNGFCYFGRMCFYVIIIEN